MISRLINSSATLYTVDLNSELLILSRSISSGARPNSFCCRSVVIVSDLGTVGSDLIVRSSYFLGLL